MKYIALIYAYISEPCDYQKIYANYQKYIPKAFEDYADFNGRLVIPLVYDTPEYRELIDWVKQRKAHLRVFLDVHYTKSELNKVDFFRLAPSYPLELEGKFSRDYGTKHRDQCKDYFCLMCGELIGDVFVDRKFMKKKKFGCLVPDLFASEELKEAIEEAGLTGIEFGGLVKDYKGREMKEKYYVVNITRSPSRILCKPSKKCIIEQERTEENTWERERTEARRKSPDGQKSENCFKKATLAA